MQNIKEDLEQFQSLQGNIINGLTFLLDSHSSMSRKALEASIVSIINQLEINDKYFNQILDIIE